jgi:hypothetical protein
MTGDLIELLQPHLENPELEKKRQEEAIQAEQEERKREKEEEQKRLVEMIKEIEEAATVTKKILQNSCFITIAKKMMDNGGREGMVNVRLTRSKKEEILVKISGFSIEGKKCIREGLKVVMNREMNHIGDELREINAWDSSASCIEILHNFLSTDNVKVTYI